MAKFWRNRTSREWKAVLETYGFEPFYTRNSGDDEVWRKGDSNIAILVPSRDSEVLILPTSAAMARSAAKNGLSKKEILQWWKDNGYGE
jgi:hypothetical protein